jgi:hypothetical protein
MTTKVTIMTNTTKTLNGAGDFFGSETVQPIFVPLRWTNQKSGDELLTR